METRRSVCALDCPDTCALLVNVEAGRAVWLRGNPDHPVTRGFLCAKVARYLERVYSPERLIYPLRRTGAKGERMAYGTFSRSAPARATRRRYDGSSALRMIPEPASFLSSPISKAFALK